MDISTHGKISQTAADNIKTIWKERFLGRTFLDWLFKRGRSESYLSVKIEETELGMSLRFPPGIVVELIERADGTFEPL